MTAKPGAPHGGPTTRTRRPRADSSTAMQSVERACNVLLSFKAEEPLLGVSEIARRLSLPKSVAYRLLDSLVHMGLVARDNASMRYRLGPRAVELGFAALGTPNICGLAQPALQELVEQTRETATLSLLSGYERFYAAQVESPQEVRMLIEIGRRCPLYAGASGRAILAHFSPAQLGAYLNATALEPLTDRTATSRADLMARLEEVRRDGYAVSAGERDPWAGAVAAPVFIGDVLTGSISVCGPLDRFSKDRLADYGEAVKIRAGRLSAQLA